MDRDIIIVAEGGGMTVGFGAGVVEAIQKQHIYSRIHSLYGSSAGAHDLAYFLSKQSDLGGSISIENLNRNKFIHKNKIEKFIKAIILGKRYNLMDLDYLINVEEHIKRLDIHSIKNSPIELYFRVFNLNKFKSEIINGKEHTFNGLIASSACIPYYNKPVEINKNFYIDGSYMVTESFENLIIKNKDKKFIYIINHRQSLSYALVRLPTRFFESLLIWRLYGLRLAFKYIATLDIIDLNKLKKHKNVILVVNNLNNDPACTNTEKLIKLFNYGKEQGEKAVAYL